MLKIIISPAKKMNVCNDLFLPKTTPHFLPQAQQIPSYLKSYTPAQLKGLWKCNDQILHLNVGRLSQMDLTRDLSPALLTYEGLQYQSMAPAVFDCNQWDYVETHLCILSGFYGLLRPFDGIVPYRLEMQAQLRTPSFKNLYDFWGDSLYRQLIGDVTDRQKITILNLASKEYSKAIEPYLTEETPMVTCVFACEDVHGNRKVKATEAKMARGEMVRFLASKQPGSHGPSAEDEDDEKALEIVKQFNGRDFQFEEASSSTGEYCFVKPYKAQRP